MQNEVIIRLLFFGGAFVLVALWELLAPRRCLTDNKARRWLANLSLVAINTLVARLVMPVLPAGMAILSHEQGWGVLTNLALPDWQKVAAAIICLDLVIYLQHQLFHYQPLLWRLHRVHHSDLDIDVTTGNRFHPLEILISMLIKLAAVAVIGAPVVAVISFEIILNAAAQFNHGNIRIPANVDKLLRLILVTPDMHRVHHSIRPHETNSNFSFNLSLWDRIFRTYREAPQDGHTGMTIGLKEYRQPARLSLFRLLGLPFSR